MRDLAQVHVIGAGLAGLAAALDLAGRPGLHVTLHEATANAGGLCRSYHDARLDRVIDTGNHLMLSANQAVLDHAARIGAAERLALAEPLFPFHDLASATSWQLRVPDHPLGALRPGTRPPGTRLSDLADLPRLLTAGADQTVAQVIRRRGALWRSFWEPMTIGVLNCPPEQASARLLRDTLKLTFLKGAAACRPVFAPAGLGPALVDPAVAQLRARGAGLHFRHPLTALEQAEGRATALCFSDGERIALGPRDHVILALPPQAQKALLPQARTPAPGMAILNAHFRVEPALAAALPPLLGLLGGAAQWIFRRDDVLSVTISAAEASPLDPLPPSQALERIWTEVAQAAGAPAARPLASRLIRMRQATFDQSPQEVRQRPGAQGPLANLLLAGAQQATGLPCTLESALVSGRAAAALIPQP